MGMMTFCVKCNELQEHICSIEPADGSLHPGPFECAKCGYRWTVKAGRQIPEHRYVAADKYQPSKS